MNTYTINFTEENKNEVEAIIAQLAGVEGLNIDLIKSNQEHILAISLVNETYTFDDLKGAIDTLRSTVTSDTDYLSAMAPNVRNAYEQYYQLQNEGNFTISFSNNQVLLKSGSVEFTNALEKKGYKLEQGVMEITENTNLLEIASIDPESIDDASIKPAESDELSSSVNIWEKMVLNEKGQNTIVRVSVIKQEKGEGNNYERLVAVTHVSPDGTVMSTDQIIGYNNGPQFDQDVLPHLVDGFMKNVKLSGREVNVDQKDSNHVYLTDGENTIKLDGYNVNNVKSILDIDREHNLTGDENDRVNNRELQDNSIMTENANDYQGTFEEAVSNNNIDERPDEMSDDYGLEKDKPKQYVYSNKDNNNYGISTSAILVLFIALALAIIALIVILNLK